MTDKSGAPTILPFIMRRLSPDEGPPLIPRLPRLSLAGPHPWRLAIPIHRDQSLHFANRNPAKSTKTSHEENFNRYKNRPPGFRICPDTIHESLPTPRDTSHGFSQAKKKLIATRPHSKIAASISEQTRRHFLTATKQPLPVCLFFAPRCRNYQGEDWEIWMAQPPVVAEVGQDWSARGV
jgi:hypothetical protein